VLDDITENKVGCNTLLRFDQFKALMTTKIAPSLARLDESVTAIEALDARDEKGDEKAAAERFGVQNELEASRADLLRRLDGFEERRQWDRLESLRSAVEFADASCEAARHLLRAAGARGGAMPASEADVPEDVAADGESAEEEHGEEDDEDDDEEQMLLRSQFARRGGGGTKGAGSRSGGGARGGQSSKFNSKLNGGGRRRGGGHAGKKRADVAPGVAPAGGGGGGTGNGPGGGRRRR
jgi:hypothetical protein